MSKRKNQNPFLDYLGQGPILPHEALLKATTEERILSVGQMVIKIVARFHHSLRAREQANYDMEDLAQEIWIELRKKDTKWEPSRGAYTTFVAPLINRKLIELRNEMRTVHSPRGTYSRLKEYNEMERNNSLTAGNRKTREDIRRSTENPEPISGSEGLTWGSDMTAEIEDSEGLEQWRASAERLLKLLPPVLSLILRMEYGIGKHEPRSTGEIAKLLGLTQTTVTSMARRAKEKLRLLMLTPTASPAD